MMTALKQPVSPAIAAYTRYMTISYRHRYELELAESAGLPVPIVGLMLAIWHGDARSFESRDFVHRLIARLSRKTADQGAQ